MGSIFHKLLFHIITRIPMSENLYFFRIIWVEFPESMIPFYLELLELQTDQQLTKLYHLSICLSNFFNIVIKQLSVRFLNALVTLTH